VRFVATPFVVRQIQSDGKAGNYRRAPSVHPTTDFSRQFLLLGSCFKVSTMSCLPGTGKFVPLPVSLLACLRLYIEARAREAEVQD